MKQQGHSTSTSWGLSIRKPPSGTVLRLRTPEVPQILTAGGSTSFPPSSFVHELPSAGVLS
jgi:hypothetical protein